ncbi:DUF6986 family protein [Williamsia sterculiae]|uniref:HpcH/HpaI aldolase/citrate lyase family protein n=1 Tax=Williamsia sterculiae TaxID=1344003 RepID=A0A1N7H2N5_9NOCA|nr:aldolase/citrate lyase family protein [Williamsia sterculiae]SIS19091.1 HpcH/HpaI aldolase/citrate lyase family protein [Williamsia sterculiae]
MGQDRSGSGERVMSASARQRVEEVLSAVDTRLAAGYPGDRDAAQPAHTVYVPADRVEVTTPQQWGEQAVALFDESHATVSDLDSAGAADAVRERLRGEPIVDLRIDLEDGYGWRPDETEDADARRAGRVLAAWADVDRSANAGPITAGPTTAGVRAKGLGAVERRRGLRTLELVLDGAGGVPPGFVVTVPKFRAVEQVDAVLLICEELERVHGVPAGALRFELQIESPQAVVGADGTAPLAVAVHRAGPRLVGLHYGTYDYSAACGIVPAQQSLEHPVADHAKSVMLAASAQTGVWVSDGSTQVIPVGEPAEVDAALRRHFRLVTRSLEHGLYQGWDMHPGHLVTRWLAVYTFFRRALPVAAGRLQNYFDRQDSGIMDEPATAQSLALVLLRGLSTGALDDADVTAIAPSCGREALVELRRRAGVVD